ncbi:MAG: hypothetical protein ABFS35_23265 [Bacteroidota bacterium]
MLVAGYFYTSSMYNKIYNSPTTPVWVQVGNEVGDYVKTIDNDTVDRVLVKAYLERKRETHYFIVDVDSTDHWQIQWDKTDSFNKTK